MSGMLPDAIDTLEPREKELYIVLLTVFANADGALVREEMAALEAFMGSALLRPEVREETRHKLRHPRDLDSPLALTNEKTLRIALRDSVLLAAADGEYHPEEILVLEKMAHHAGVDADALDALYDWVTEGWKWLAKGRSTIDVNIAGDELLNDN
mgnify:FL=1